MRVEEYICPYCGSPHSAIEGWCFHPDGETIYIICQCTRCDRWFFVKEPCKEGKTR